jgi:hypothetical protein
MMSPYLEDLCDTSIQILAKLIDPKSHDRPARALELNVTPYVISASGAIGITVKLIPIDFYIDLETTVTPSDESQIEPTPQGRVLRFRSYFSSLQGLTERLLPGRLMGMPG